MNLLTPNEHNFLMSLAPKDILGWGVIHSHSDLAISAPLTKEQACNLTQELREKINQHVMDTVFDVHAFKGPSTKGHVNPHYFIIPRSHINKTNDSHSDPKAQSLIACVHEPFPAPKEIISDFDHSLHPTIALNRRITNDPTYVQESLRKKLSRAQQNLDTYKHGDADRSTTKHVNIESKTDSKWGLDYAYSTTGNGKPNEDCVCISSLEFTIADTNYMIPLFGLFDGHSNRHKTKGREFAEEISKQLPKEIENRLKTAIKGLSEAELQSSEHFDMVLFNTLKVSFAEVSAKVYQEKNYTNDIGTTATISLVFNDFIYTACCGDSRAIYSKPTTEADQLNVIVLSNDRNIKTEETEECSVSTPLKIHHSGLVSDLIEKACQIKLNQTLYNRGAELIDFRGLRSSHGLLTLKSLGHIEITMGANPRPDITKQEIIESNGRTFLIMASDGLWDVFSSREISTKVQKLAENDTTCHEMAQILTNDAAIEANRDNISILIVELTSKPFDEDTFRTAYPHSWERKENSLECRLPHQKTLELIDHINAKETSRKAEGYRMHDGRPDLYKVIFQIRPNNTPGSLKMIKS